MPNVTHQVYSYAIKTSRENKEMIKVRYTTSLLEKMYFILHFCGTPCYSEVSATDNNCENGV